MSALEQVGRDHGAYFTADELLCTDFPDPRWAVEGLIAEGLTLVAGAPKLGKSWLVLGIGLAVAGGTRALGKIDATAGDVLYCALEDTPRRLRNRLTKLVGTSGAPRSLTIATMLPEMPRAVDLIAEWLDDHRDARMVVVDVLGKIRPAIGGSSADRYEHDYRVISALKRLADNYSVAVVVVTHTRKMGAEDPFDTVSGSTGLTGAADTTMVLRRARGETGAALHVTGRDVEESEYAVTFDPLTGRWTLDGSALAEAAQRAAEARLTAGLGDWSTKVVEYVNRHPEGVRAGDVERDLDFTEARRYLSRLAEAGRLTKSARGLYIPTVPSVPSVPSDGLGMADGTHGTVGTLPQAGTCTECAGPMVDLGDGATSHPGCAA